MPSAAKRMARIKTGMAILRSRKETDVISNINIHMAEFSMVGCVDWPTGAKISNHDERITVFPVPSTGIFEVSIPQGNNLQYEIVSSKGAILERGSVETGSETAHFDLSARKSGVYFIRMIGETGKVYRVKVVKR